MGYTVVVSVEGSMVAVMVVSMGCTIVDTMVDAMEGLVVGSESEFGLRADASRTTRRPLANPSVYNSLKSLPIPVMAPNQLKSLYEDLLRSFNARPSDLKKCGVLLSQLKVWQCHEPANAELMAALLAGID
jgi:hypothetical protein